MKFAAVSKGLILGLALMLASSALAATKGSLQLLDSVTVNGTQLKAGDYKLLWDGSSSNVEVSIMQGKKVLAKVPAKVVNLDAAAANDAAVTQKNNDGTSSLIGVRFSGKKFALDISDSDGAMGGSSK
ncbi:MAG TPA: hypothetical protein VMU61_05065 [Candidatus Aquilonibacter sp.]|nr:hypothetical protein [Candidatus Aquilonibacter sp.]